MAISPQEKEERTEMKDAKYIGGHFGFSDAKTGIRNEERALKDANEKHNDFRYEEGLLREPF